MKKSEILPICKSGIAFALKIVLLTLHIRPLSQIGWVFGDPSVSSYMISLSNQCVSASSPLQCSTQ